MRGVLQTPHFFYHAYHAYPLDHVFLSLADQLLNGLLAAIPPIYGVGLGGLSFLGKDVRCTNEPKSILQVVSV